MSFFVFCAVRAAKTLAGKPQGFADSTPRYRRLARTLSIVIAGALLLTAQERLNARAQQAQTQNADVKIDNFSFAPGSITIPAGTTVTWSNRDDIPHTVVSDDKIFKSRVLDTDERFSYTFSKPGTYPYFCSVHPKMTGKIIVQ